MNRQTVLIALCLAALSTIAPFAIDMYLSAMPAMTQEFNVAGGKIELTMVGFLIGFCCGQLLFGPISDKLGRKPVLIVGLGLFFIASLGCLSAATLTELIAWRIGQGIGGSVGIVLSIAIVRDLFTGKMATRLMALVMAVSSIAPIIAPAIGSLILRYYSWHTIFIFLAVFSLFCIALILFILPETRSTERRANSHPRRAFSTYRRLFSNRDFMPYAATAALSQASLFVYIAGSPFVFISLYGLTPFQFSMVFALNAVAITIGTFLGTWLSEKHGPRKATKITALLRFSFSMILLGVYLLGLTDLPYILIPLFFSILAFGMIYPITTVLALEKQAQEAGSASALMGALSFGAGALASVMLSIFADGSALPLYIIMVATAGFAAFITWRYFEHSEPDEG